MTPSLEGRDSLRKTISLVDYAALVQAALRLEVPQGTRSAG